MKKYIKVLVFLLLVIILVFYLYYQNNFLQVTYYEIYNDKITESFDGFKIVHISDYHNTKSNKLNKDLQDEVRRQKPNIIVITGDLVDSNHLDIDVAIDFIQNIKDIAPIYYVTGNHELLIDSYQNLKERLQPNEVIVLDNSVETIEKNEDFINIIGIEDSISLGRCAVNLNSLQYDKDKYSILLSHRPELLNVYADSNIDLAFTGHAHGGQIRIPFIGGVVAPNQGFFPKYTSGVFNIKNTSMVVSRGIGNSILPFRINNRPELVVVTLKNNI